MEPHATRGLKRQRWALADDEPEEELHKRKRLNQNKAFCSGKKKLLRDATAFSIKHANACVFTLVLSPKSDKIEHYAHVKGLDRKECDKVSLHMADVFMSLLRNLVTRPHGETPTTDSRTVAVEDNGTPPPDVLRDVQTGDVYRFLKNMAIYAPEPSPNSNKES
jgi:hypothetical protein